MKEQCKYCTKGKIYKCSAICCAKALMSMKHQLKIQSPSLSGLTCKVPHHIELQGTYVRNGITNQIQQKPVKSKSE